MGLLDDLDVIPIKIASPLNVLEWSYGEVTKPTHYCCIKSHQPEKDGLFCERIFGAIEKENEE